MNSLQKLLACLMLGLIVIGYGCKKDDNDPVGCAWATEVQDEYNAQSVALDAFLADPTNTAKCEAWKASYGDYLDALESHVDCATVAGTAAELQAAIDSARDSLNTIQC